MKPTIERVATASGIVALRRFAGRRPGLVALHGFGLHGGQFGPLAQVSGWRVTAPDLPGHGLTTVTPVDLETTLGALETVLPATGSRVLGYSQGGRLALHLAWRHPSVVTSLVVVSAGAGLDGVDRVERAAADDAVAGRIERDGVAAYVDGWIGHPVFGTARLDPAARAADRAVRLENDAILLAAARRGLGQGALPPVPVVDVRVPILWVAGALDPRYADAVSAAARPDRDRVEIVPDVGHNVVAEAPGALAAIVEEWSTGA